jgi:hypothetical protein
MIWQFQLHWLWKSRWTALQFWPCVAVFDDFNTWWIVVGCGCGVGMGHVGLELERWWTHKYE